MEKYQLDNPNNARVFIDYTKRKDKVKFEYIKTTGVFKIIYMPLWFIWVIINFIVLSINFLAFVISYILVNGMPELSLSASRINFAELLYQAFLIFYIFGIPFIAAILFRFSKWKKAMPYLNDFVSFDKHYNVLFKPQDVINNRIEIPLFKNVMLDYKATEDFSKYLLRFEIIEHPFNDFIMGKKKPNAYLWKAAFYFKQPPQSGELKVCFK